MEKFEQWWKGLVKELEDDIETIDQNSIRT